MNTVAGTVLGLVSSGICRGAGVPNEQKLSGSPLQRLQPAHFTGTGTVLFSVPVLSSCTQ